MFSNFPRFGSQIPKLNNFHDKNYSQVRKITLHVKTWIIICTGNVVNHNAGK